MEGAKGCVCVAKGRPSLIAPEQDCRRPQITTETLYGRWGGKETGQSNRRDSGKVRTEQKELSGPHMITHYWIRISNPCSPKPPLSVTSTSYCCSNCTMESPTKSTSGSLSLQSETNLLCCQEKAAQRQLTLISPAPLLRGRKGPSSSPCLPPTHFFPMLTHEHPLQLHQPQQGRALGSESSILPALGTAHTQPQGAASGYAALAAGGIAAARGWGCRRCVSALLSSMPAL